MGGLANSLRRVYDGNEASTVLRDSHSAWIGRESNAWQITCHKPDVLDCTWLQQLMGYGLLSAAFRLTDEICILRVALRQRDMLLASQSRHIQYMQ